MVMHRAILVVSLSAAIVLAASPALAERVTVSDPAGDTVRGGLDIISATLRNRDHGVVSEVHFLAGGNGSVVVGVKARGEQTYRLVTVHRVHGPDTAYMLDRRNRKVLCPNLGSEWRTTTKTLHMRMPSTCMNEGDYGAVRTWVITEVQGDGFTDFAPQTTGQPGEFTDWVSRG